MIRGYSKEEWELYITWLERYVYEFEQTCDGNDRLREDNFEKCYGTCAWCNWGSHGVVRSYNMFAVVSDDLPHAKLLRDYYTVGRTKTRVDYTVGLIADLRAMLKDEA